MSFGFGFGPPRAPLRGRPLAAAIRSLFAANEPGVWYDPSDFSTLFQDAAGTAPVTAVEQPVGLMLDKSKGLVRGPELLVNGDFENGSVGWEYSGNDATHTLDFENGKVRYKSDTTSPVLTLLQRNILQVGRTYEIIVNVSEYVSGFLKSDSFTQGSMVTVGGRTGVFKAIVTALSTVFDIKRATADVDITLESVSVRELPGNHATQPTATSRPVLSARKNLTTASESVGYTSPWGVSEAQYVVTSNATTAPDGTMTADLLTSTGVPGTTIHVWVATVTTFTVSFYVKQGTKSSLNVLVRNQTTATNIASSTHDFTTGTTNGSWTAEDVGNGWTRLKATVESGVAVGNTVAIYVGATGETPANESWYVWGLQVEAGATATRYQRVNTATDYDTAGFPHYLRFDGVDDWLVTNTITPGIDKVQVFAGGSKNTDIAFPVLVENSTDPSTNNGTFSLSPRQGGATQGATFRTKGTIQSIVNMLGLVAPTKFVLSGIGSISEDVVALRSGGVEVIRGLADQGTGDFLAYPIYIGSRAGTSLWFNGHLYSLIVRFGSNLPVATIEKIEKYVNTKTRAY